MRLMLAVYAMLITGPAAQAADPPPPTLTEMLSVPSKVLGEERHALVHRPGLGQLQQERYPVLYVLDGHELFWQAVGTVDYLSKRGRMPPMIVVGIVNTARRRDFAPTAGANRFLQFLEEELVPAVEARYPTEAHRVLAGHSLGATLVIHAVLTRPKAFAGYIATSPNLLYEEDLVGRWSREPWSQRKDTGRSLYVSMGDRDELDGALPAFRRFRDVLEPPPAGMTVAVEELAGVDHMTAADDFLLRGLPRVFAGWKSGSPGTTP